MSDYQDIAYEVRDRTGLITLNRPDRLNAWTGPMEMSIRRAMASAAADESVRVIVVTGAGRGFCAGADMSLLQQITPEAQAEALSGLATRSKENLTSSAVTGPKSPVQTSQSCSVNSISVGDFCFSSLAA